MIGVSLNSFGKCDFQFLYKTIDVPAGAMVEWNIAASLAPTVTFVKGEPAFAIDIKQDDKDPSLRPFIDPHWGAHDDGSLFFQWTANPNPAVTHEELPYFVNVNVLNAARQRISCTSDPTIANNHH